LRASLPHRRDSIVELLAGAGCQRTTASCGEGKVFSLDIPFIEPARSAQFARERSQRRVCSKRYYFTHMMCRFEVLYLLSRQTVGGYYFSSVGTALLTDVALILS